MLAVVEMSLWPSHSWICFMGTPCLSRRLAQECPYGIIRTNGKTQCFQGFQRLSLPIQFLFQP